MADIIALLQLLRVHGAGLPLQHTKELLTKLQGLVSNLSWSVPEVIQLFESLLKRFDSRNTTDDLQLWLLKMLHCVEINHITPNWKSGKTLIELIQDTSTTDKELQQILGADSEKTLDEIICEIEQQNIVDKTLLNEAKQIVSEVVLNSQLNHSHELVRVLKRLVTAVEKTQKITPRLTQMVSWALMALSGKGRLIEVSTGEGKTCIVAMFAAFRALQGHRVDIMSSSPVLAQRDFKDWQNFYKELKISVSCNINKMNSDLKMCYTSQVVYGTAKEFAADWLRQHFGREDIRADRPFQCAIVDEVDSLMLDKGCDTVYLGSNMPALQHLNPLLAHIWNTVNQYRVNKRGQTSYSDEESAVKAVKEKVTSGLHFTPCDVRPDNTCCYVPGFLKEFVEYKLEDWVNKAFEAQTMASDHEYVIERHGVVPVDFSSTGVLENFTEWTDGLHQFLQMKHQQKLSDMSAVTNFMSNVGLLQKYEDQIYGVTGTLGQKVETETLQKIYNGITLCYIPTFKHRKLFEVEGVIINVEEEWLQKICEVITAQTRPTVYRSERAVLVICETIGRAKAVHQALGDSVQNKTLYISNNMDNRPVTDKEVSAAQVIIATNLAGRGTDLKVSESVKAAGGLFVLQTFLPSNARVEAQAFGRTGRQGSPGSAQLIICSQHLPKTLQMLVLRNGLLSVLTDLVNPTPVYGLSVSNNGLSQILSEILTRTSDTGIKLAKRVRDESVAEELNNYLESVIPEMKMKQELFSQYLDFINDFYQSSNNQPSESEVTALHEFWAFWLLININDNDSNDVQKGKLASDLERARESLRKGQSPLSNLHNYTLFGNKLLEQGHFKASILMYSKAIELDRCWAAIAFYNRAFARLVQKDNKQDPDCIEQALADLHQALRSVELYCQQQDLVSRYSKAHTEAESMETRFDEHQRVRRKLFNSLKKNIDEAIKTLNKAETFGGHVKVEEQELTLGLLSLFWSRDPLFMHQLVKSGVIDEIESLKSLGFTKVYVLDYRFSLAGFLSKIARAAKTKIQRLFRRFKRFGHFRLFRRFKRFRVFRRFKRFRLCRRLKRFRRFKDKFFYLWKLFLFPVS